MVVVGLLFVLLSENEGAEVFDAHRKESFKLRAMIYCTVNDFSACGNLSRYSVKGHKACPVCEQNTSYCQLVHGKKTVYLGHRRFLPKGHHYRNKRKNFDGRVEVRPSPEPLTGVQVYEKVKNIENKFGKPVRGVARNNDKSVWKKKFIFFELPYWKTLLVRHCIDVMHVEKNVFDSVSGTLLNMLGKTKDNYKSRLDLAQMKIRSELQPQERNNRIYLPPACYTLSRQEKLKFCECLSNVKVSQGYSSNIRSLVSMKDLKLVGLKSHDCHVLMQDLLAVAIRSILPKHVRYVITRLCFFFKAICSKVIDINKLDELQKDVVEILCQLEMYFPPSFFDIMVHLTVHLIREIKLCGPVYLRWMYPFERYMKILKGYVRNRYRPEASIVESYIAEEVIEFCTDYLSEVEAIGIPRSRHEGRVDGKGTRGMKATSMSREDVLQAHLYVLNNIDEVQFYIEEHKALIDGEYPNKNAMWKKSKHNQSFIAWFEERVCSQGYEVSDTVRWLAKGPCFEVICYTAYDINGYSFYTKCQDDKNTVQNSGISLVAHAVHFASSKDKNPVAAEMTYYGVIEDIWEIDYTTFRIPVFKCKWVDDSSMGKRVDDLGFTLVNFSREGHKNEPFVMASQAKQVFYIEDPADENWHVVVEGRKAFTVDEDDEDDIETVSTFSIMLPLVNYEDEYNAEESLCARNDHAEGIYVD